MLDELVSMQTLPATVADQLRGTVAARANILISGGTSSGKTTLLNALAATIPDHERILLIEAPSEIVLHKRNLIRLEARLEEIPIGQEKPLPPVPISQFLRTALRLRPDDTR